MIDLAEEDLIPISQVPKRLPRRPNGRAVHLSAIYRWQQKGLRGTRLETIKIGGTTYTSVQALQRFADALTASRNDTVAPISRLNRTRQAQAANAANQVRERLGLKTPSQNPAAKGCTPDAPCGAERQKPQVLCQREVDQETPGKPQDQKTSESRLQEEVYGVIP